MHIPTTTPLFFFWSEAKEVMSLNIEIFKTKEELVEHLIECHCRVFWLQSTARRFFMGKTEKQLIEYHRKYHEEETS